MPKSERLSVSFGKTISLDHHVARPDHVGLDSVEQGSVRRHVRLPGDHRKPFSNRCVYVTYGIKH
jgi:hypothetical protein